MNTTEAKLEYELEYDCVNGIPVIVAAAGSGTRMGGINKQFLELNGIPVIIRTLLTFEKSKYISRIILVAKQEDLFTLQLLAEKYSISKLSDIVIGGCNRQESIIKGFNILGDCEDAVLIHDGARPFVTETIIGNVVKALEEFPAAVCGVKLKDTVKQLNCDGTVKKTLNRNELFAVQTPQGVKTKEYKDALAAIGDISVFTDDTSIMESAGYTVKCVDGDYRNIKITTPEDISVAESYINQEE